MSPLQKFSLALIFFAVLGASAGFMVNHSRSFGSATFSLDQGVKANVYASKQSEGGPGYDANSKPINTVSDGQKLHLHKGTYVVVLSQDTKDYATATKAFAVTNGTVDVAFHPDYTPQKLTSLLPGEQAAITKAIMDKFPSVFQNYAVQPGKLYKRGNWYGTTLRPADSSRDILRLILKKDSGWKVITDPPTIIIAKPLYPDIPGDVVSDVNNFQ